MKRIASSFTVLSVLLAILFGTLVSLTAQTASAEPVVYEGTEGAGKGKHIVFLVGDEEYRSEETLPALAKILAKHHGFKCTVLFSLNPKTGEIDPNASNVPGMEALKTADLAVVFWRFRNLPDDQMKHFVDYLDRAGPVVGLRTSTHAFRTPKDATYAKYSYDSKVKGYEGGFGRQVLGETWAGHYGKNHVMSTRLDPVEKAKSHPIMRGVENAWVHAGGYWTEPIKDSEILMLAQPLQEMKQNSPAAKDKKPCPGAWVRSYTNAKGKIGRVFTTTYGASQDIANDGYRRLLINACFWAANLEKQIKPNANVSFVGDYNPSIFTNEGFRRHVKPSDIAKFDSPIYSTKKPIILPKRWADSYEKRTGKKFPAQQPVGSAAQNINQNTSQLELKKGDMICLVGNALGERMQHQNYWETELHQRFPKLNLSVRNLCFPADEVKTRPRSQNFGSPEEHLKFNKASVVLYFFGFNESFQYEKDGKKGLDQFKKDLEELVTKTQQQNYSDNGAPRIVLVSPIASEKVKCTKMIDSSVRNPTLEKYSLAIKEIAKKTKVQFVDVFHPTKQLFENSDEQLTLNGIHLNSNGYKKFATILNDALFGKAKADHLCNKALKAEIDDKNFHWWHRYRTVNGYSIYGKRGEAGTDGTYRNREVMNRELEILDQLTVNREQRAWKIAQGKTVPAKPDDSNTLPFINPKSNVGTDLEPKGNAKKRGSLTYLPAEEQLKHFKLKEGYVIELVASEEQFPQLANPLAMNFDAKGRLWVTALPSYPHWKPKSKMDDKLLILEDNNNDGKMDVCKTFAGGLHQPTGFELGHGGVYIANQPDLLFLKDTDGDDKADTKIRKLVGFDTADSHHGLGAFEWSPGGSLHMLEGLFKYSGVETPEGPLRSREGALWRYEPKTERFKKHSTIHVINPWGHVFDDYGLDYITDGTTGTHYYMPPASGHVDFPRRVKGGFRDKKSSYPKPIKKVFRPSPGNEIVSSTNFPDDAQGDFLVNNVIGLLGIMQYSLEADGAGIKSKYKGPLVESTYGNFRPVDCQFGPDGALYICDWQNALIGHLQHNLRDPNRDHSHGRIWRIRHKDRPLGKPIKIAGASTAELCKTLSTKEARVRYRVRRELAARKSTDVLPAIKTWVASLDTKKEGNQHHLLEALWVQQSHIEIDPELLKTCLNSSDFRVRAAATRVLCDSRDKFPKVLDTIAKQINDKNPRVRLEAVRACSFFRTEKAAEIALGVLEHDMDKFLEYTLEETMKQLEKF